MGADDLALDCRVNIEK